MSPVVPETRLESTLLDRKPKSGSLFCSLLTVFFVCLVTVLHWRGFPLTQEWVARGSEVFAQGKWYQLWTTTLLHGDGLHLASNIYMLAVLSFFVFGYFGLFIMPLMTFLLAGFVNGLTLFFYPPELGLLGASGWVYLLGGFWLSLYALIARKRSWTQRALRVLGISLAIFFPTSFEPQTSYLAHFFGFIIGVLAAVLYFCFFKKRIRSMERWQVDWISGEPSLDIQPDTVPHS